MKHYVVAHDLGTTGNKATLFDAEGKLCGSAFFGYGTDYARTSWAEQNPEDWWQAVCTSTRQLLSETGVSKDDIACITFSGQMMGCVPLDEQARPLRNAIIWADQRSTDQEQWMSERIDRAAVYRITGHRLSASYSLCKMLWLRDHQAEIFAKTYKFVHAKDAMVARMTGNFVTDPSDASGMNLYDLESGTWSEPIMDAAGITREQLPDLAASSAIVGEVLANVADELGVPAGTPVVIGAGDGASAAAGAGCVGDGVAYNYVGSSSWIGVATRQPIFDPAFRTFTWGHILPEMFTPTGTMQSAGASYQWTRDQLALPEVQAAAAHNVSPYELMNAEGAKSSVGANKLLYLPYLMGERSPRWNTRARGAFVGLTIRHTRADMLRAVLEGVTMNLRIILEAFTSQGATIEAMRVIGGGARGRFWNEMMANIYGMPIQRMSFLEEATSMGAALAGGIGVGLYSDYSLIDQMNPVAEIIDPDPAHQAAYREMFPVFEATYQALVPIYDQLATLP
ncbi:MAG: FGGY-family carbohydrate kinase [Anaerolineae bacterium]|nr:FGGY-family carbohydrate kinase [Anaerolineae bacterium]